MYFDCITRLLLTPLIHHTSLVKSTTINCPLETIKFRSSHRDLCRSIEDIRERVSLRRLLLNTSTGATPTAIIRIYTKTILTYIPAKSTTDHLSTIHRLMRNLHKLLPKLPVICFTTNIQITTRKTSLPISLAIISVASRLLIITRIQLLFRTHHDRLKCSVKR